MFMSRDTCKHLRNMRWPLLGFISRETNFALNSLNCTYFKQMSQLVLTHDLFSFARISFKCWVLLIWRLKFLLESETWLSWTVVFNERHAINKKFLCGNLPINFVQLLMKLIYFWNFFFEFQVKMNRFELFNYFDRWNKQKAVLVIYYKL